MKKFILGIMAMAIGFASIGQGENGKHKDHHKGKHKEYRNKGARGFESMSLSDAQKAQMKTINENFRNQVQSLRADKSLSEEALKQRRETLRNEHRSQLQALLTPEQRKQWEEKRKQHELKGKDGKKFDKSKKSWKQSK